MLHCAATPPLISCYVTRHLAWHGAARIWVQTKERKRGNSLCLACVNIFWGQANKTWHTLSQSDVSIDEKTRKLMFFRKKHIQIYGSCTHRRSPVEKLSDSVFALSVSFCHPNPDSNKATSLTSI